MRYDHSWSYYPEQSIGGVTFLPGTTIFPRIAGRGGLQRHHAARRRRLRPVRQRQDRGEVQHGPVSRGRGQRQRQLLGAAAVVARAATSVTRTWTDANGNFTSRLRSEQRQRAGSAQQRRRLLRPDQPARPSAGAIRTLAYDPQHHAGLGRPAGRLADRRHAAAQMLPRVSLEVGYTRRWLQNFTVTDNRATTVADYTPFSVAAPLDPRLPGGGGYDVSGLYDVVPAKSGVTDNYRTSRRTTARMYQIYNGVDINVNARLRNGLQLQAGSSTGAAGDRLLRRPGEAARTDRRILDRQRGARLQPGESLLPLRAGHHHPGHGRRLLHDSEDRRAAERRVPEQPGHPARGELRRSRRPRSRRRSGGRRRATSPT